MKFYYSFRFLVYITLAVLIGVYSHQLFNYLQYLVGGVMILFGIEGFFISLLVERKTFFANHQFYLGIVDFILGIVMVTSVIEFDHVCIIWATWTIVREAFDFYEYGRRILRYGFISVLSFILSVIEIVFSVLLLLYATEHHAMTHIYLLIPEMVINGISPLLFNRHKKRKAAYNHH